MLVHHGLPHVLQLYLPHKDLEVAYRTPHGRRITLHRQSGYVEGAVLHARDGKCKPDNGDLLYDID